MYSTITKIDKQTLETIEESDGQYSEMETLLEMKQKELVQIEQATGKLLELYEDGMISKQRFSDRMAVHEKNKKGAQDEIEKCRYILAANADILTVDTIQERVSEFKEMWSTAATPSEKNTAYRLLIDRIVYDREGNGLTLEVLYK